MTADIGLIGLAVMGANLALNMAEKGSTVAVYNRTWEKTEAFMAGAGPLADRLIPCRTLEELAAAIAAPRPVVMMVKAGEAVDAQIAALRPLLAEGDILIDCGNANFRDTRRRVAELEGSGLAYLGVGVSGGEEGARHGPSIMAGGPAEPWSRVAPIFNAIAARHEGEPCCALVGPEASGHFVKTLHNGVEYADMQMIAEIYGVLRDGLGMDAAGVADAFSRWNEGPLKSYLIEITAEVARAVDWETGEPALDVILDSAGQKGTGRWSVIEAQRLGSVASTIEAAVGARNLSADMALRGALSRASLDVDVPGVDVLFDALHAGKIIAYAQGFDLLTRASMEFDWDLNLAQVARIWRAGCIIRSAMLDDIANAFEAKPRASLLTAPVFAERLAPLVPALRDTVARAALSALPTPALSNALLYLDQLCHPRGTANMLQGLRDYFGQHGFERTDRNGSGFHGPWVKPA